ncbi:MAG: 50S ribosomal protein L11 [Nanoarchaeota archaeon]
MQIKLIVDGGSMQPGPALSQKLGPAGINIQQVITKVNEATKNFKGMKLPIELDVDVHTKEIKIKIFSPPVSELIKKELKIEKGSGLQKKVYAGNASIEQIINVAKTKSPNLLCKNLKSAVKSVVGSCVSLGILVENQLAVKIEREIDEGKYDKEINEEKTETSEEKRVALDKYFLEVKSEQERIIKQEQAAKEAEVAAATAPPTEVAKPGAVATPVKEEPKKELKKK